jgi:hypothetical protein
VKDYGKCQKCNTFYPTDEMWDNKECRYCHVEVRVTNPVETKVVKEKREKTYGFCLADKFPNLMELVK